MNKKLSKTTVSLEVMKQVIEERTHVLEELSNTDPLTKVANRRALFKRGNFELSRVNRTQNNLTLILLDCDFFKDFNDEWELEKVMEEASGRGKRQHSEVKTAQL